MLSTDSLVCLSRWVARCIRQLLRYASGGVPTASEKRRAVTITGVVERMLDHAANGRWQALGDVLDDQFEIVEPDSLTARRTRRSLELRVVEVLEVVRGRVRRSEVFLADTAALLATLLDRGAR